MIVVADTSPINYLVLINKVDILHSLYGDVVMPQSVCRELTDERTPPVVRAWMAAVPAWVRRIAADVSVDLPQLDPGETEAIALALELRADLLLIDDKAGRYEASRRGIKVAGLLAVLDEAGRIGILNFEEAIEQLANTTFRLSPRLLAEIRRRRQLRPPT